MFVFANPLQPLIDFFEAILKFFHDTGGLGWGTSIIALTLVVRLALLPLTLKQFKSMQSMARLQPEIKKLQERYKNDKERLNQEMMRFYRENKVNPFASCLPMVAQLPVFLALFYMLRADLRQDICPDVNPPARANPIPCGDGGDAAFFFIPDLTNRAYGWVLVTLIVLYVGSQLLSTLLMATTTDKTQRMIFLALPFFFVLFVWQFPAGLLVYWITTNLWTIVQQAIVRKRLGPLRPPGQEQESLGDMLKKLRGDDEDRGAKAGGRREAKPKVASGATAKPAVAGNEPKGRPSGPPPAPPRRKKKRSGRRR
ncbi:MAG: YidC/Oxa1 family membrane protein insertase [Solirubrobacteraceae bacterium]